MKETNATDTGQTGGRDWLALARNSYSASTSYMDANWRKAWEDCIALFQSRHPAGSKYNSDLYKSRSHIFRPKTRSVVRKNEAAAAAAFFSNVDLVSIEAENSADKAQNASADLIFQLINYRLQKSIPWFKVLIGAIQEMQVYGVVVSYQYWNYKEEPQYEPITDELTGEPMMDDEGNPLARETDPKVLVDKPCIELIPLENFRIDAGADWLDPINSSPYLIRRVPMYVCDVKEKMGQTDRKTGQPQWKKLTDDQIRQAMTSLDTLSQARENRRQDPKANNAEAALTEFEIVWVHENFIRIDGEEVVYWTMGTEHMLTEPKALQEVYFTGERPFAMGNAVLEAHKVVPESLVQMGSQLQREANDVVNQRLDNVKLVLNKRWLAKRGKQVDIPSLHKNMPGSVTLVDDVESDVKEVNWPDVTASAYQEQDRINVDFDELVGNFSGSSVMTNRKLNETVGGMSLLNGGASQLTEYLLLTCVETWVEPVLRQLVKLEQQYETNLSILALAGQKAQLLQKYGVDQVTDAMLDAELTVRVNVGMGATDPRTKLQKFVMAIQSYSQAVRMLPNADHEQVRKEIFGLAGYRDGARFFKQGEDPNAAAMQQQMQQQMQMMQQMQQQMQQMQMQLRDKEQQNQIKAAEVQANSHIQAVSAAADADLKQAQAVKTLIEATIAPAQALMQQAIEPEGSSDGQ